MEARSLWRLGGALPGLSKANEAIKRLEAEEKEMNLWGAQGCQVLYVNRILTDSL
jgi:hypothetical protein